MNLRLTHPALRHLIRQRGVARLKRIKSNLLAPRRLMLTVLALILSVVWLSQILVGLFLREPADPIMLSHRISYGLMGFTAWQILKVVFRKPVVPFEWTPCERQMLITAPIGRSDLVGYRLLATVYAVLLKSACFVLIMLPDMNLVVAGLVGIAVGLAFCEFLKTAIELLVYGSGKRGRTKIRLATGLIVATAIASATTIVLCRNDSSELLASPAAWRFLVAIAVTLGTLTQHGLLAIAAWPFSLFSKIILATAYDTQLLANVFLAFSASGTVLACVHFADRWMHRQLRRSETALLSELSGATAQGKANRPSRKSRVPVPRRLSGIGPIAWRQFVGAWHYRSSIGFSFAMPAILCCIPMFSNTAPQGTPLLLVGSVAFYSYLLLPAALMLDFRRDVDRLAVLKTLPVSARNVVIGQLLAPVILCSVFQGAVFTIGAMAGQATPLWFVVCWLAFIPVNLLIMSFENFVFMLHPHRKNKEGVDVFLRTILTFTGKGLTWGVGVALIVLWAMASTHIAHSSAHVIALPASAIQAVVFVGGAMMAVCAAATIMIQSLTRLFERFDPGTDAVGMN